MRGHGRHLQIPAGQALFQPVEAVGGKLLLDLFGCARVAEAGPIALYPDHLHLRPRQALQQAGARFHEDAPQRPRRRQPLDGVLEPTPVVQDGLGLIMQGDERIDRDAEHPQIDRHGQEEHDGEPKEHGIFAGQPGLEGHQPLHRQTDHEHQNEQRRAGQQLETPGEETAHIEHRAEQDDQVEVVANRGQRQPQHEKNVVAHRHDHQADVGLGIAVGQQEDHAEHQLEESHQDDVTDGHPGVEPEKQHEAHKPDQPAGPEPPPVVDALAKNTFQSGKVNHRCFLFPLRCRGRCG